MSEGGLGVDQPVTGLGQLIGNTRTQGERDRGSEEKQRQGEGQQEEGGGQCPRGHDGRGMSDSDSSSSRWDEEALMGETATERGAEEWWPSQTQLFTLTDTRWLRGAVQQCSAACGLSALSLRLQLRRPSSVRPVSPTQPPCPCPFNGRFSSVSPTGGNPARPPRC